MSDDEKARLVDEAVAQAEAAADAGAAEALSRCEQAYERTKSPRLLWPMAVLHGKLRQPGRGLMRLAEYEEKFPAALMPAGRREEIRRLREVLKGQMGAPVASAPREPALQKAERGRARDMGWVKWTLWGVGGAGVVAGGVLLGLDGRQSCPLAEARMCPTELDTGRAGAGLLGAGVSLLGAGVVLLLVERRVPAGERPGR